MHKQATKNIFQSMISENFYYKMISAAMVIVLFFWVLDDREGEVIMTTQVRPGVPEDHVLMAPPPDKVRITIRGRWNTLRNLREQDIEPIFVNLNKKTGKSLVWLKRAQVKLPTGFRVVHIQPSSFPVNLQPRKKRKVPVKVRVIGEVREGHELGAPKVEPKSVEVSGPGMLISKITQIETEPIDVSNRAQPFVRKAQLRHAHATIRDNKDGIVDVSINITQRDSTQEIKNLTVKVVNTSYKTEFKPKTINMELKGPRSLLDKIDRSAILVSIDLKDLGADAHGTILRKPTVSNLPPGILIKSLFPKEFQVRILPQNPPSSHTKPSPRSN